MILVDTSVWIDHFRNGNTRLAELLNGGSVLMHAFVLGELALGNLRSRKDVLRDLGNLPQAVVATDAEVLGFIAANKLHGRGIGYIDAHLLAASRLTPDTALWTYDRRLAACC